MTAAKELQSISDSIDAFARRLPLAESMGADTTHLRVLLEHLRQENAALAEIFQSKSG